MFHKLKRKTGIKCLKKGNVGCRQFSTWKKRHPLEYQNLKEKVEKSPKLVYIPNAETIFICGQRISVDGGVKSLDPPCLGVAFTTGEHPYTCSNCHQQTRSLKNLMKKRKKARYLGENPRVGKKGFRNDYAKQGEHLKAFKQAKKEKRKADKTSLALVDGGLTFYLNLVSRTTKQSL